MIRASQLGSDSYILKDENGEPTSWEVFRKTLQLDACVTDDKRLIAQYECWKLEEHRDHRLNHEIWKHLYKEIHDDLLRAYNDIRVALCRSPEYGREDYALDKLSEALKKTSFNEFEK